jgi:hypothetical protein
MIDVAQCARVCVCACVCVCVCGGGGGERRTMLLSAIVFVELVRFFVLMPNGIRIFAFPGLCLIAKMLLYSHGFQLSHWMT